MARKTKSLTIDADGRDKGKVFVITEMSAVQGEKWGVRALLALVAAGAEIPDDVAKAGIAGVAAMGLTALKGLKWEIAEPLFDELLSCAQYQPDPRNSLVRALHESDIEEITTLLALRKAAFELCVSFLPAVAQSNLDLSQATAAKTSL